MGVLNISEFFILPHQLRLLGTTGWCIGILLQSTIVEVDANNRDGLTAQDLAYDAFPWERRSISW